MQPANPVQWRVTQVIDMTGRDATGQIVKGKNVTYQIMNGPAETVFVPGDPPTADQVLDAVRARAANLNDIATLTSGT